MNFRRLSLALLLTGLGLACPLAAAEAPKPGYQVVVDVTCNEAGQPESFRVVDSDDQSGEQVLNQIAIGLARSGKYEPQLKDGKPVRFTVRAPFNFPVEGDEGATANEQPRPVLAHRKQVQPVYPADLAARGEVGGAILELIISTEGYVRTATVLRASNPEFADSAVAAVKQWVLKPALKDGLPVETRWRVAFTFAIDNRDVDWKWRIAPRPSLGGFKVVHPTTPPAAAPAPATLPAPGK